MVSKLRFLNSFSRLGYRKITQFVCKDDVCFVSSMYHLSNHGYCTMTESIDGPVSVTESPELPNWVKFSENENPNVEDSNDDFVVPAIADWVENQKHHDRGKLIVKPKANESDLDRDVDKISKILKIRYSSPDEAAEALGCDCIDVNVSDGLVKQLLRRFSHDWVQAFGVFKWAKGRQGYNYSSDTYDLMVDILGKAKRFSIMWEVVDEMRSLDGYITLITMSKVMRRFCRARKWKDAIDTFRRLEEHGLKKDVYAMNILLDALAKEDTVEDAQKVYDEFKDITPPDTNTFNILIHGWCKYRKLDQAQVMLKEMERFGFKPTTATYTSFIESYCRDKDFRKVDETLDEMQAKGCPPNVVTYTIVMHALGKSKLFDQALSVYEKMKNNGCDPDVSFYSSLIYILSLSGRLKDAQAIFEDMEKQGTKTPPDVLTYNTMISVYCNHSQEENALKMLRKMEEASCKPDLKTYAPLLKMCGRKKRMKVLSFLLNHMFLNDLSLEVGTYALLVNVLCKSGKLEHACSFFEEMVLKGFTPKDSTCKVLMEKLEAASMGKAKDQIEKLMLEVKARRSL